MSTTRCRAELSSKFSASRRVVLHKEKRKEGKKRHRKTESSNACSNYRNSLQRLICESPRRATWDRPEKSVSNHFTVQSQLQSSKLIWQGIDGDSQRDNEVVRACSHVAHAGRWNEGTINVVECEEIFREFTFFASKDHNLMTRLHTFDEVGLYAALLSL